MDHPNTVTLNEFWSVQKEVTLLEPFAIINGSFEGKIRLQADPKRALEFRAVVPFSYPLSNDRIAIRFYCTNNTGIRHLNADNSVCMMVPPNTDFNKRLHDELKLLCTWRDKYYLDEETDGRYDYPVMEYMDNNIFLFTDVSYAFSPGNFGIFKACQYTDNTPPGQLSSKNHLILNLGPVKCQWADRIFELNANVEGYFYFLGPEPIITPGKLVDDWSQLDSLVSQAFKKHLNNLKTNKDTPDVFCMLLGYYIPGTDEIHWEIANINKRKIPVTARKVTARYYEYNMISQPIGWSRTVNISYERYFGRGQIDNGIADKKILILGTGALGSSLANILARTGCIHLSFADLETLEPGNICRSEYNLGMISQPKTIALYRELASISPFLNLGIEHPVSKILDSPYFENDKKRVEAYDLIFDCTSDMELAWVLDRMKLTKTVFNLSVTNEAKELVCVVGGHHIATEKTQLCNKLLNRETELIYEGTGCWSPTFKASYFDINCLVNLAVKNLNLQSVSGQNFHSFLIRTDLTGNSVNLKVHDY